MFKNYPTHFQLRTNKMWWPKKELTHLFYFQSFFLGYQISYLPVKIEEMQDKVSTYFMIYKKYLFDNKKEGSSSLVCN